MHQFKLVVLIVLWGILGSCAATIPTPWGDKCEWRGIRPANSAVAVRWRPSDFPLTLNLVEAELEPEAVDHVKKAAAAWNSALGITVFRVHIVSNTELAVQGIVRKHSSVYVALLPPEQPAAGVTRFTNDPETGYVREAFVFLRQDLLGKIPYQVMVQHELGHVLGLDHSPQDRSNIMFPVAHNPKAQIKLIDVQYILSYLGRFRC